MDGALWTFTFNEARPSNFDRTRIFPTVVNRSACDRNSELIMQHLRSIPTLTHGLLDHLLGMIMIVSPWIFDFHAVRGVAVYVPSIIGGALVVNSLFTRYEMGLVKWIPVSLHVKLDVVLGISLAISPWAWGFADRVFLTHLLGGACIALLPLFSVRKPFDESIFTEVIIREGKAEVIRYARSTDRSA